MRHKLVVIGNVACGRAQGINTGPLFGPRTIRVPQDAATIQDGIDKHDPRDDVLVLAYISIGEDVRTIGLTDEDMLRDARFVGDASGPRVDPRGPDLDGQPLRLGDL